MNIKRVLRWIRYPRKAYVEHIEKEKVIFRKYGKEKEKTFYVIRLNLPEVGMLGLHKYVLDHVAYAVDHGYVPVLDSEKYPCLFKEDHEINGTQDPWRYYFEPISEYTVEDCRKYQNVILGRMRFPRYKAIYYYRDKEQNKLPEKAQIHELYEIVERYIRFRPELRMELEEKERHLLEQGRVLGIHVRGTDMYTQGKQHPVPTGETKDFSRIDDIMRQYQLDKILLCTDTESTVNLFRDHYGDKVISMDVVRQENDTKTGIHRDESLAKGRENHKYLLGKEVLIDMYLLSKCTVLLCGPSNVAFASIIYNDNAYEKIYYCV